MRLPLPAPRQVVSGMQPIGPGIIRGWQRTFQLPKGAEVAKAPPAAPGPRPSPVGSRPEHLEFRGFNSSRSLGVRVGISTS